MRFVHKVAGLPAVLPEGYRRERPCVIALDNYSVHHSQIVKDRMPALEEAGVRFFFLPPYSPEMNAIEPHWRQIKYHELPDRSHKTAESLQTAVDDALTNGPGNSSMVGLVQKPMLTCAIVLSGTLLDSEIQVDRSTATDPIQQGL